MKQVAAYLLFPLSLLLGTWGAFFALDAKLSPALVSGGITLVAFGVAMVFERWLPRIKRAHEPGELRADLTYAGITGVLSDPLAHALVAGLTTYAAGLRGGSWEVGLPLGVLAVVVLLVHGLGDYWAHRLSHRWEWWWKLHAVHHAPARMTALNNLRLHPLDYTLKVLFGMGPVLLLGFSEESVALAMAIKGVCLAYQHADLDLRHGPLNLIFATNSVHRWHHSASPAEGNRNFGGVLSLYDILFASLLLPAEDAEPERMGLFGDEHYPRHNVLRATAAPWCWKRCVADPPSQG
ncbi:sterol desaturase family protein [Lujinxingia vulgaris]|uniref:Sterol desaturase family protein n=1 Tax=Lujinxingia vulgaris TaxID=2600176 RepID=A0A5C6XER6_9DELT|nr:sterol desaturase family protein [Lujinxingia vulgaris]TXD37333.1 sterol desaturase family protein [Lujinxingia vulgaris]